MPNRSNIYHVHRRQKFLKRGVTLVGKFGTTTFYGTKMIKNIRAEEAQLL